MPGSARSSKDATAVPSLRAIVAVGVLPLAVLGVCFLAEIPLGTPGYLIYRYSPLAAVRLVQTLPALLIGGVVVYALWRLVVREQRLSRAGLAGLLLAYGGLCVWTFFAPPVYVRQISVNLLSPSHDGAFVYEAKQVTSLRDYLSTGFYERIALSPEQMRGTRVISNPAGMTVLAWSVDRLLAVAPGLEGAVQSAFRLDSEELDASMRATFARPLLLAVVLTLFWGLAIVVAYRLCRLWMPPLASAAVSVACVFNPATVNFTPGKDPAQLLSVVLLVYLGLVAYERRCWQAALGAGAVLAASLTVGLIHVWVALIVLVGTGWHARSRAGGWSDWGRGCLLPAVVGFAVAAILLWWVSGWNVMHSTWAVARRFPQIQRYLINGVWTLMGVPLFLLFAGSTFWCLVAVVRPGRSEAEQDSAAAGDGDAASGASAARLGRALTGVTVVVMTYTYFFANNNETPRLWIPFLALLTVSLALSRPLFRLDTRHSRRICVTLIAVQVAVTVFHWGLMDARESEYRIMPGPGNAPARLWN